MSALWAVALLMLCSGMAKLCTHDDVAATFTRLKVPRPFNAPWLARAFPFLEIALAGALVQPSTVLRAVAGVAAVVLFIAFLVLVVRARGEGVSCGCFGEASAAPVSGQTVVRNVLFLALAVLALIEALVGLTAFGSGLAWLPLAAFGAGTWAWASAVALLAAGSAFLVGRETVPAAADAETAAVGTVPAAVGTVSAAVGTVSAAVGTVSAAPPAFLAPAAPGEEGADEPPRHPFPDALIVSEGRYETLHALVRTGAVVALRLSLGCGSCSAVIARLPEFAERLGPVRVRVLMPQHSPDTPVSTGSLAPELVLADPAGQASTALGLTSFPSAVLLGTDLLTAGGPVFGAEAVLDFLAEIREVVTTEMPAADASAVVADPDASPSETPTSPAHLLQEPRL